MASPTTGCAAPTWPCSARLRLVCNDYLAGCHDELTFCHTLALEEWVRERW